MENDMIQKNLQVITEDATDVLTRHSVEGQTVYLLLSSEVHNLQVSLLMVRTDPECLNARVITVDDNECDCRLRTMEEVSGIRIYIGDHYFEARKRMTHGLWCTIDVQNINDGKKRKSKHILLCPLDLALKSDIAPSSEAA